LSPRFSLGAMSFFELDQKPRFDGFNHPELFLFGVALRFDLGGEPLFPLSPLHCCGFSVTK
jgi:hypothetical protein